MNQLKTVFLVILFLNVLSTWGEGKVKVKPMRFSIVESWPEPYAFFDSDRNLTGGAIKDIIEAIGKNANLPVEFVYLSRNRVDAAMERGKAEVRCYVNEAWAVRSENYLFSQPIFQTSNSIIWKKDRKPILKIDDVQGKTIGTVAGYIYRGIDVLFKSGKAKRADVVNEGMNVTLLQRDRIDYAIVETTSFNWILKKKNGMAAQEVESFLVDVVPVKCAVLKKNAQPFKVVESAIEKMKQDGTIKAIEAKYGLR